MIVTVEEAATKRCQEGYAASNGTTVHAIEPPTAPVYHSVPALTSMGGAGFAISSSPEQGPTAPFYCIGPACMAWKWATDGDGENWRTPDGQLLGYCGKARR